MPEHPSRRIALLTAIGVVVVSGGALAWAGSGSASPAYRTAVVQTGNVQQLLNLTGTSHVVAQAAAAFATDGTVTATPVHLGDHVVAGQVLAKIDPAPLQASVVAANATLAAAQATLATDQAALAAASAPVAVATRSPAGGNSGTDGTTSAALREQGAAAQAAVGLATSACGGSGRGHDQGSPVPVPTRSSVPGQRPTTSPAASPGGASSPTASPGRPSSTAAPGSTPAPSTSSAAGPAAHGGSPSAAPSDCLMALAAALHAEQRLSQTQTGLMSSGSTARTSTSLTGTPGTGTGSSAPATSSTGRGGTETSPAAAVTLATAAVQAAHVALALAKQRLAAAVLTSPLAGVVATQPFVVGQSETRPQAITVIGSGAVQVVGNVPASALSSLRVGQAAAVTADGATTPSRGVLSQIGLLPTVAANGTTTYPVTVLVAQPGSAFHDGGDADVDITTKTVSRVLIVPNSAVRNSQVSVVRAGKLVPVRVQLGAVGALTAQVVSGLTAGQVVLLADPSQPLPANSTTTGRPFGGAGGPGAGGARRGAGGPGPAAPVPAG